MTTSTDIGQSIKELREARGMPKSELARRAGTTRNTLYRIETGRMAPSWPMVEKIAHALTVSAGDVHAEAKWSSLLQFFYGDVFSEKALRAKLEEVERFIEYALVRAEYWEQELERGRMEEYATYKSAHKLADLAVDEFSSFNGWLVDKGPARNLLMLLDHGLYLEIGEEYDALIDALIERTTRTQCMLFAHAEDLAVTEAQKDAIAAKRREMNASNTQLARRSA
jgi:transcriptional regulator with XRE-family HTH domain